MLIYSVIFKFSRQERNESYFMARKIFAALMLLTLASCSYAADIDLGEGYHVPHGFSGVYIASSDGTAIQNAVDNIQDGGTIILSGSFKLTRDINIKKSITIKAEDSNNKAVLEMTPGVNKRVFRCQGDSITLENLVIKGGFTTNGGGVKVDAKTKLMTITNCDIVNNRSVLGGGGLYSDAEKLVLTNCNITSNDVSLLFGGGIMVTGGEFEMTDSNISGNNAFGRGGGIYFTGVTADMNNCRVTNNTSRADGAGIYLYSKTLTLTKCNVSGNLNGNESSNIYADKNASYTEN